MKGKAIMPEQHGPVSFDWNPGPVEGVDVLSPENLALRPPGFECGDTLLVLVAVVSRHNKKLAYWDKQIIVPTETGFDDQDGESWGAWSWSDVSWWVKLDQKNLPTMT